MQEKASHEIKKKSQSYFWIILIVVALILFSTNPTEVQFKEFLRNDFKEQGRAEGPLVELIAGPVARLAGLTTVRNDYLVFSTYEISVLGDKYLYFGILNHFSRID